VDEISGEAALPPPPRCVRRVLREKESKQAPGLQTCGNLHTIGVKERIPAVRCPHGRRADRQPMQGDRGERPAWVALSLSLWTAIGRSINREDPEQVSRKLRDPWAGVKVGRVAFP